MVKNIEKVAFAGSGNGAWSNGIGVMLTAVTTSRSSPRITVPAGRWSSSPGIVGVVTNVSLVVGEGMVT